MGRCAERTATLIRETHPPLADVTHRLSFVSQSYVPSSMKQQAGPTPDKLHLGCADGRPAGAPQLGLRQTGRHPGAAL